jgi:uncharacterized protein (TIGR00369 family)
MNRSKTHLPTYAGCIVCGQKHVNPNTLNLRFRTTEDGVEVEFRPGAAHEGYKEVVHGGILCAVLDETIGWAVAVARGKYFVTAELTVRFIRPLAVGTRVVVRGRALDHKPQFSVAEGEVIDGEGNIYARATGKFFVMPDQKAREVHDYLTFQEDDLDFLAD